MTELIATRREFKLMLEKGRFRGDEEETEAAAEAFREALEPVAAELDIAVSKKFEARDERTVEFLDTETFLLRGNDYVLRRRADAERTRLTLKVRHPDLALVHAKKISAKWDGEVEEKLEDDVKAPLIVLHSFSSTIERFDPETPLRTLGDVDALFPGLGEKLDHFGTEEPIQTVGGFTALERVLKGTRLKMEGDKEKAALIVWHEAGREDEGPVVAEFSFHCNEEAGDFTTAKSRKAEELFRAVAEGLGGFVDPRSPTKTAFVYERAGAA